jgi:hypothetical protein
MFTYLPTLSSPCNQCIATRRFTCMQILPDRRQGRVEDCFARTFFSEGLRNQSRLSVRVFTILKKPFVSGGIAMHCPLRTSFHNLYIKGTVQRDGSGRN